MFLRNIEMDRITNYHTSTASIPCFFFSCSKTLLPAKAATYFIFHDASSDGLSDCKSLTLGGRTGRRNIEVLRELSSCETLASSLFASLCHIYHNCIRLNCACCQDEFPADVSWDTCNRSVDTGSDFLCVFSCVFVSMKTISKNNHTHRRGIFSVCPNACYFCVLSKCPYFLALGHNRARYMQQVNVCCTYASQATFYLYT